ncbi:diguanylate cyclase [Vibrio sp. JPW-9-11-11]|uniref:GGDEF domain-containing protein n=1 Tax=Vibrio sp. JPW-9-11-11 TaxID=1416532 RepID=UPI00159392FD|nr:GGDEF domain-containing protein [Vibrio sp. JPW-9-11-11]NVD07438.1 diguanylate cyclase [Vibrio sp. JPW-9-11-11]
MDQLLLWLWDASQGHGIDFVFLVLCACVSLWIYIRAQNNIAQLVLSSPHAVLVIDSNNGELLLANAVASQLLAVRVVGKQFVLPDLVTRQFLLSIIPPLQQQPLDFHLLSWPISENKSVKLDVTGRPTWYRRRTVWALHFSMHQSTTQELQSQVESLSVIKSAFDNLSELIFIKNQAGQVVSSNRAYQQFWKDREQEGSADIQGVIKGRASSRRWTITPDGRSCLLESYQSVLISPEGETIGTLGISHDVTDWHNMQKSLRDEMEKRRDTEVALAQRDTILQNILESSPDSIGIFNENMVYQACNQPFVEALGIDHVDDLIGKRLQDVIANKDYQRLSDTDNKVLYEGKSLRYIDQVMGRDGEYIWYDVVKSPFRDPASGTNGVLIMARDVSERYLVEKKLEEANQELERLSFIDGLTQIANRRRFNEQLDMLWYLHIREKQPMTVMLCDIDYFKHYNDFYGHQRGDEALIKVASVFKQVLTRSSDCVARYGGEEFAFILPNTTTAGALSVAERIHHGIAELSLEHQASDVATQVTISIGLVSLTPQPLDSSETIVALADSALYQAKANGRNQTCVHHTSEN